MSENSTHSHLKNVDGALENLIELRRQQRDEQQFANIRDNRLVGRDMNNWLMKNGEMPVKNSSGYGNFKNFKEF